MSTLDERMAREIARAIRRMQLDHRLTWSAVIELSRCQSKPDGFSRQWLQSNAVVKRAYQAKKAAQRGDAGSGGAKATRNKTSEIDRLRAINADLRAEIEDRDRHLDHFCDVLQRMLRNAVDKGGMTREALLADLPELVRRGMRTGMKGQRDDFGLRDRNTAPT